MTFIDEVDVTCVSGKGGAGAVSFRRESKTPRGGPDGGDGGRGGHVILRASNRLNTLEHLRGRRMYEAENGQNGQTKNCHGSDGNDLLIEVPVGTQAWEGEILLCDLREDGAEAVICRGGRGGRGNVHFKSSTNRTPMQHDVGGPAEERELHLELKLLADVGLLGFPNAGKSTFISVVSNARPRVADYPFTTLVPNLGVVVRGFDGTFVVADIPGIIEGAADGAGLGHRFLKHVERCRVLLHLVSLEEDQELTPVERWTVLNRELARFSPELAARPQIPVLTKADLRMEDEIEEQVRTFEAATGQRPLVISAAAHTGVEEAINRCWSALHQGDEG